MRTQNLNLNTIIDTKKWQKLQDALASVAEIAIITTDYKGVPITTHSRCSEFCAKVREDKELRHNCMKCDSRGGLEASRLNKPYVYLCHYNILDTAIPILIDDKYVGALLAGQVILSDQDASDKLERICTPISSAAAKQKKSDLNELYALIPRMSYERIKVIVNMLFHLCNYIVTEAEEKNLIIKAYEEAFRNAIPPAGDAEPLLSGYSVGAMEKVKNKISGTITSLHMASPSVNRSLPDESSCSPILFPALEYIYSNKREKPSLEFVAGVCHVSPSYFSRLFVKEMGENYSSYLNRLKIEWAKQLLEKTDMSVNEIGYEFGFSEAGYFIKTFKKLEGVTPSVYRKYIRER